MIETDDSAELRALTAQQMFDPDRLDADSVGGTLPNYISRFNLGANR